MRAKGWLSVTDRWPAVLCGWVFLPGCLFMCVYPRVFFFRVAFSVNLVQGCLFVVVSGCCLMLLGTQTSRAIAT